MLTPEKNININVCSKTAALQQTVKRSKSDKMLLEFPTTFHTS
jgi:hypothetical protein